MVTQISKNDGAQIFPALGDLLLLWQQNGNNLATNFPQNVLVKKNLKIG